MKMSPSGISINETLFLATLLVLILLWIRWRRQKLKIFEELGIPGPPPHFLFGNMLQIKEKGLLECQDQWVKKYGQIAGYYQGLKPVLMITDSNILKRIFIKDFNLFSDRPEVVPLRVHSFLDSIIPASEIMDNLLLNQKGEEWKRLRSKLSPIFSANKLKMMIPFVQKVADVTISILDENTQRGETIDIYQLLQRLTMDVIAAQTFAIDTDIQNEGFKNELYRSAHTIFDNPIASYFFIFALSFPEFSILGMALNFLKMFFVNRFSIPPLKITNLVGKVVKKRREDPSSRKPDLLQNFIDASEPDSKDLQESQQNLYSDNVVRDGSNEDGKVLKMVVKRGLSDIEIKANALVVFLAGYETTSSSLAYAFYMLTKYPEYQAQIQKEIDSCISGKVLDYYILNNLQFMERFMLETMRFYPPAATNVVRIATTNVDFGYVRIPKGMEITVPVNYMHFSEDNWENPQVFDPDRFLLINRSSNSLTNYWVFGIGPRNCLGTRLASVTSKVVLAKLLQRFTFEKPDNPNDAILNLNVKFGTMVPDKVLVKVKKRNKVLEE